MNTRTITAISTPIGQGGIGIIRMSGPESFPIAARIFQKTNGSSEFTSHKMDYGFIVDPFENVIIDEVFLVRMKNPKTYTREDVVEIQAHSGKAVLEKILDITVKLGATLAEPGEFTKRAFLNGRIDLPQAEAVIDMIQAANSRFVRIGAAHLKGELGRKIENLRNILVETISQMEAEIDFSDDIKEDGPDSLLDVEYLNRHFIFPLQELIRQAGRHDYFLHGFTVPIIGKPNVGKSSLMNCLLGRDRVIVNELPGTTRDVVGEKINIDGVPVQFFDCAGVHETHDPIEKAGIVKTEEWIEKADLILFVVDASRKMDSDDRRISEMIGSKPYIIVANKTDIPTFSMNFIPSGLRHVNTVPTSALKKTGIDELYRKIRCIVHQHADNTGEATIVPNKRHLSELKQAKQFVENAITGIKSFFPLETSVIEVREAIQCLDRITGRYAEPEIIDRIFNRFCIGK